MQKGKVLLCLLTLGCSLWMFSSCGGETQPSGDGAAATKESSPADQGKAIFQQYCTACHLMEADVAGPALKGVVARWNNDTERLKAYIRNPQKLIDEKDPNAVAAYEKYKPQVMTPFPQLSDADLDALIAYLHSNP